VDLLEFGFFFPPFNDMGFYPPLPLPTRLTLFFAISLYRPPRKTVLPFPHPPTKSGGNTLPRLRALFLWRGQPHLGSPGSSTAPFPLHPLFSHVFLFFAHRFFFWKRPSLSLFVYETPKQADSSRRCLSTVLSCFPSFLTFHFF